MELILKDKADSYAKARASDILAFLLAPSPNKYLKDKALNHAIFGKRHNDGFICVLLINLYLDIHTEMLFTEDDSLIERGLQFLWCITNNYPEAQKKVGHDSKVSFIIFISK